MIYPDKIYIVTYVSGNKVEMLGEFLSRMFNGGPAILTWKEVL